MKKNIFIIIMIACGSTLLASCACKTCKKESEISVTICKEEQSQQTFDNTVANYQNNGYTCN